MRRLQPVWLAVFLLVFGTLRVVAQQDDPSEIFVKAYLSAQEAEKLEREDRLKSALAKYRFAGSLIDELRKGHAQWQPAIVEYRGRKIGEGILRVQQRISRQDELGAASKSLPEIAPASPESDSWSEPGPEVVTPQLVDKTATHFSAEEVTREATKRLREKINQLQAALETSRSDLEIARKENETVSARLKEATSRLKEAENQIKSATDSETRTREQLARAQDSIRTLQVSHEAEQQQWRAEIAQLKNAVTAANEARVAAEKQRDQAEAKAAVATDPFRASEPERDQTLAWLGESGDAEKRAQERTQAISAAPPGIARELVDEAARLRQQLADTERENQYFAARVAELRVQLDKAESRLQTANLANREEAAQVVRENDLLRSIVLREREEESRRDGAKKLILAEMARLKVKSASLTRQIEFLAQPVTPLSREELELLQKPLISISRQKPDALTASFLFAKKSAADSDSMAKSDANAKPGEELAERAQGIAHGAAERLKEAGEGQEAAPETSPSKSQ
jgi:phage shock protein A